MAKMTEEELSSLVNSEINSSYGANGGADGGELAGEISTAMDYYLGQPFGNEEDGQSQVISTDVQDVIEWVLPSLMRIFASNEKAVLFDPLGPNDEDAAKQETDIVNHTFYKENDGFYILYSFFKDALLSKNGIVKTWWDDAEVKEREEYSGIDEIELAKLLADPDIEPIEHTERLLEQPGGKPTTVHDVTILRITGSGRTRIEVVPPEEFLISKDASSIFPERARFTAHKTTKTRSDLRQEGFSQALIDTLPVTTVTLDDNEISIARNHLEDDQFTDGAADDSMKEIEVFECYIKIDYDGDGIAELRQITMAGKEILVNEPVEENPFTAITPIILTHKFYGLSLADAVMDLQLIKSTLLRGVLNNTYLANNQRTAIQDGMVNLDDLLTSRSGGVIRTLGPPAAVMAAQPFNQLPAQTFQVLETMDGMRKERTGIGQESMGLESNVLANGRTGVISQSFDQSRLRTELIARIFAEIGVKPLFRKIHGLLQRHQNKQKWFRIRGEWVQINPSEWRTRSNMTVNVGLGSGNKDQEIAKLMTLASIQEKLLATGVGVTPENIYNTLEKLVEASGFKDVTTFFTDPATQEPPPPPPPDPQIELINAQKEIEAVKAQNTQMKTQLDAQNERMKIELQDERERIKMELEYSRDIPGGLPEEQAKSTAA